MLLKQRCSRMAVFAEKISQRKGGYVLAIGVWFRSTENGERNSGSRLVVVANGYNGTPGEAARLPVNA